MENERALNRTAIESLIYEIRGQKVMLDRDLAKMYGVETKVLNQAVKRNMKRFPEDFMFQLTQEECLRSQIVTLNTKQGQHLKYMPHAFTEQGVAMLSSILKSDTAIEINIRIMRTFVAIRNHLYTTQRVTAELEAIKAKLELLERNDEDNLEAINDLSEDMRQEIDTIYQAIAALSVKEPTQKQSQRQKIGFKTQNSK
ncbi:MAG: ORF6N domain-containing protein [Bacteroidales bacterium]|nr:ORF6N domain-containing protein [Bacteroidales bacterium]